MKPLISILNMVSTNLHQIAKKEAPHWPRHQLTSQDKGIISSEIIPYFKRNFTLFILAYIIYEIVGIFLIFLYSTPVAPSFIVNASMYALIRRPSANSKEIYFIWKFVFVMLEASFIQAAMQSVIFKSMPKERKRQYWNFINFFVIVLYIIDIPYQFTISFSVVVVSIVAFISSFFIFKRSVSVYVTTFLIVLLLVCNILWYKLWTVELFSVPVVQFLSQFTIVGSLLYTVGLNCN